MRPTVILGAAALALFALGAAIAARSRVHARPEVPARVAAPPDTPAITLHVPHSKAPAVDGDVNEPAWLEGAARTEAFLARDGTPARPYSDARFVWSGDYLYVTLYAADLDVQVSNAAPDGPVWLGDSFRLAFTGGGAERVIEVSPDGALTDARRTVGGALDYAWQSGARAKTELEGKPNDTDGEDEEWLVEMAIPLAALDVKGAPGATIGLGIRRCDASAPGRGPRTCGAWGEAPRGLLILD